MDARVNFGSIPGEDKEEEEKPAAAAQSMTTQPTAPTAAAPQEDSKTKMRQTVQKAADDVDAAQNFFDDKPKEQPKEKPKDDQSGKIAQLEREKKQLQDKIEQIKKQQKIDLQHAKKKAVELSEEMVSKKLEACRIVYEVEFETLARQFEQIKNENEGF